MLATCAIGGMIEFDLRIAEEGENVVDGLRLVIVCSGSILKF